MSTCKCMLFKDVIRLAQLKYSVHLTCDKHADAGKLADSATPEQYHIWAQGQTSHLNSQAWGMLASGLSTIYVCDAPGINAQLQWQTLYHELGHAIAIRSVSDCTESTANIISEQLYTLLRWHERYEKVRDYLVSQVGG